MATFADGEGGLSVRTKINAVLQHADGTSGELVINDAGADVDFRVEGVGNTNLFRVDAGAGQVSVGGSPTGFSTFDIKTGTNKHIVTAVSAAYGGNVFVGSNDAGAEVPFGIAGSVLHFSTAAQERMRITSAGDLGIGTTSPQAKLQVLDRIKVSSASQAEGALVLGDGGSTAFNVGIARWNGSTNAAGTGGMGYFAQGATNAGGHFFYTGDAAAGSTTERMRITTAGLLVVGTTSSPQISAGGVGTVSSIALSTSGTAIVASMPASATGGGIRSQTVTAASTSWYHLNGSSGNGSTLTTNNIFIYGNGDVQNANNSYGAISDAKLKENIADASPKLEKLMQVRVRSYNLKGDYDQHKQIGVVAQELEAVFPSMIEETQDRDLDGNPLETTTKSVKYSVFVPMLIKALQEQQVLIEDLKARLDAANL